MAALLEHVPALLEEIGVKAEPLDWDDHVQTLAEDHVTVMSYEAARARAHEFDEHAQALSAPIRDLLENGRRTPGAEYSAALTRRDRSRELLDEILDSAPIIVGPAALGPARSACPRPDRRSSAGRGSCSVYRSWSCRVPIPPRDCRWACRSSGCRGTRTGCSTWARSSRPSYVNCP